MALREEFESSGNWLFKWRSYLPLVFIALSLFALHDYDYLANSQRLDKLWGGFCLLVSFFGLAIRAFTVGHNPKGTSGRTTRMPEAERLNTTGIYSIVRHPLYVGNFFVGLGIALFAHLWWLVLIYILAFSLYYEKIMFAEEAYLSKKFGEEFVSWCDNTPAFIPRLKNYVRPNLPFSLKNVLKREYNGFFAVIAVLFAFRVVANFVVEHRFEIAPWWVMTLAIGFAAWVALRTLKKKTHILDVEGR